MKYQLLLTEKLTDRVGNLTFVELFFSTDHRGHSNTEDISRDMYHP